MVDQKGKDITKTIISYRLQFINNSRFKASSLSNLVHNLAVIIHKIKCKYEHDHGKCETCGIKYKDCGCCLKYKNTKNYLIEHKCLCCKETTKKYSMNS